MFHAHSDRMYSERAEGREGGRVPLHNVDHTGDRSHQAEENTLSSSSTAHDGQWGERDIGGPVNLRSAMLDYEEMRKELTNLSKTRSAGAKSTGAKSNAHQSSGLKRVSTAGSRRTRRKSTADPERDVEAQAEQTESHEQNAEDGEEDDQSEGEFELGDFLKDGHFEKRQEGRSAKKVGVVYKNLTVKGVGATATFVKTLPSAVVGVRDSLNIWTFYSMKLTLLM